MTEKPRVLFVDDEPNILQGLRRMLHSVSREWSMEFAQGGDAALLLLKARPFDVVVTDMRMPGIDGAELLAKVRDAWPQVTRIVLSGHSDQESVLRSVHAAHQYLLKPCDADQLRRTVRRALHLRGTIASPSVRTLITRLNHVPSLPSLFVEINAALANENASVHEIGEIVGRDIAFTAKLLQLVNSAFFGLPRPVASPGDAAVLLGVELIRSLVLGAKVMSAIAERAPQSAAIAALWQHSLRTAASARAFAMRMGLDNRESDHAFLAGLMHDVGRLVLLDNLPAEVERCDAAVENEGIDRTEAETRVFGATHEVISAALLGTWGLPDATVETIAYVRRPRESPAQGLGALTAVHLAEALDDESQGGRHARATLDHAYLDGLGLSERLAQWRAGTAPVPRE